MTETEKLQDEMLDRYLEMASEAVRTLDAQVKVNQILIEEIIAWRAWWFVNERAIRIDNVLETIKRTNANIDTSKLRKRGLKGLHIGEEANPQQTTNEGAD